LIKRFLFCLVYPIYKLKDYPVLYRGKNFKLVNFGIFAAFDAMAISIIFFYYLFLKGYIPTLKILFLWLLSGVFIWIGAKLFFFLVWWEDFIQNPKGYIFQTGFSNHGGIIGGILLAFLLSFLTKINIFIIFDGLCIGSFLGQFFGRLGCYNYGCCYGKPTDVQWSICYTNMDSKILRLYPNMKGVNIHPTQLYTAFINLLAFIGFIFFLNHITKTR